MEKNKSNPQHEDHKFLFGFFTGIVSFLTYEYFKDPAKRKNIIKETKDLQQELMPFFNEFKNMASENTEILKALRAIDDHLGTTLLTSLHPKIEEENPSENKEKKLSSIRQFFKIKK
ncbi:hypothetical protein KA001_00655 [Patescibacteria group bacterium]|nr:hypothetical protein [Patescibacteria group bacterium]